MPCKHQTRIAAEQCCQRILRPANLQKKPTLPPTHPQHAPGWAWRLHRRGLAAVEAGLKGFKEGAVCMLEKIGELCHLRGAERAAAVVGHQRQVVREDP
jgi:hypothetical protein